MVNQLNIKKDFMKVTFNLNDDELPLGRILIIPTCIIAAKSVFQNDNKYYPQVYIHQCGYGL